MPAIRQLMTSCVFVAAMAGAAQAAADASLNTIAAALESGNLAAMREFMSPELQGELSEARLTELRKEMLGGAEEFREVEVVSRRRFVGSIPLSTIELKNRGDDYVVRLLWSKDGNKIVGFDVVNERDEERPSDRSKCFGPLIERFRNATHSIEVEGTGLDGELLGRCSYGLWKESDEGSTQRHAWKDPASDRWYEPIDGCTTSGSTTFEGLEPGTYRAVAWGEGGLVGVGEPFEVAADEAKVTARVALEPGGSFQAQSVDAESGKPLADMWISLEASAGPIWQGQQFRPAAAPGQPTNYQAEELPKGNFRLTAGRSAAHPDDWTYELADGLVDVEIKHGDQAKLELKFRKRKLTEEEIVGRWPWVVFGRVTDRKGEPVSGATVRAHCGMLSIPCTGATITDAEGNYRLRFSSNILLSEPGVYFAGISASRPGMCEANLNRQGNLEAADADAEIDPESHPADKIIHQNQPRRVDFVLEPTGELEVRIHTDKDRKQSLDGLSVSLKGEEMPPGCSAMDQRRANRSGSVWMDGVPLAHAWYLQIPTGDRESVRTLPFRLTEPQRYSIVLHWRTDETGLAMLDIVSLTDALGVDRTLELVQSDPQANVPVSAAEQDEARGWLRKIAAANRDWLDAPSDAVNEFAYDFVMWEEPARRYVVPRDRRVAGVVLQGIAYVSAARCLTEKPENVVVRQIDRSADRVTISYSLLKTGNLSAGNGVLSSYHGFFSKNFREGTLSFDPRTYQVLECRTGDVTEKFGDYFELADGRFVPRMIEIEKLAKLRHCWRFAIYEPGLWLFDKSVAAQANESPSSVRIENVSINGAAARRMTTLAKASLN